MHDGDRETARIKVLTYFQFSPVRIETRAAVDPVWLIDPLLRGLKLPKHRVAGGHIEREREPLAPLLEQKRHTGAVALVAK